jgi:hypothetical protein
MLRTAPSTRKWSEEEDEILARFMVEHANEVQGRKGLAHLAFINGKLPMRDEYAIRQRINHHWDYLFVGSKESGRVAAAASTLKNRAKVWNRLERLGIQGTMPEVVEREGYGSRAVELIEPVEGISAYSREETPDATVERFDVSKKPTRIGIGNYNGPGMMWTQNEKEIVASVLSVDMRVPSQTAAKIIHKHLPNRTITAIVDEIKNQRKGVGVKKMGVLRNVTYAKQNRNRIHAMEEAARTASSKDTVVRQKQELKPRPRTGAFTIGLWFGLMVGVVTGMFIGAAIAGHIINIR